MQDDKLQDMCDYSAHLRRFLEYTIEQANFINRALPCDQTEIKICNDMTRLLQLNLATAYQISRNIPTL